MSSTNLTLDLRDIRFAFKEWLPIDKLKKSEIFSEFDEDTFDYYFWPDWLIEMDNLQKALDSGEITQEEYEQKKKKIK